MLVIGMVASGILTAFVFSRRVTHRSGSELTSSFLVSDTQARLRAGLQRADGQKVSDVPGIYVDQNMQNPPPGAIPLAALNFPPEFLRFQTTVLSNPGQPVSGNNHGDGRMCVVEAGADLDGDGLTGVDVNNPLDGVVDIRRVRVRVQWTTPNVQ